MDFRAEAAVALVVEGQLAVVALEALERELVEAHFGVDLIV